MVVLPWQEPPKPKHGKMRSCLSEENRKQLMENRGRWAILREQDTKPGVGSLKEWNPGFEFTARTLSKGKYRIYVRYVGDSQQKGGAAHSGQQGGSPRPVEPEETGPRPGKAASGSSPAPARPPQRRANAGQQAEKVLAPTRRDGGERPALFINALLDALQDAETPMRLIDIVETLSVAGWRGAGGVTLEQRVRNALQTNSDLIERSGLGVSGKPYRWSLRKRNKV